MSELPKTYDPQAIEAKWYDWWKQRGFFRAEAEWGGQPYTIVIPPPNVTGILHMGHALNETIQDVMIRRKRMQGFNTLWVPGTDHAGIATQNVVERQLKEQGKSRWDMSREEFLKLVWAWKEQYGGTILRQLEKLGNSCDWSRTRFTMDEGLSEAVAETFVRLYDKKLIYRGEYIINWCPRCETALSDEESEHTEQAGRLYHIRYPVKGGRKSEYVVVATTRPETMLGDTAVAVNPRDERYAKFKGKTLVLPILNREIPVIEDDFVDPKFGTGAVKVTPAHDPNDFDMGRRHALPMINVMTPRAQMNENAGPYQGMSREECRKKLVADLQAAGLLVKIDEHAHAVGHCYRCHTAVEPRLSPQWFVKMKPLARPAIDAVKDGRIRFVPERWSKVYLEWMENIRDWCISRQIWWGHRIPVFYCQEPGCQHEWASKTAPEKCPKCGTTNFKQDEDVLDTWFSSWLWPFSVFGWPQDNPDLRYYYPTNDLVTAPEIIFFWVARMIMAGLEFMGEVPFRRVYLHGTVRDNQGRKMSKSLGNSIDPLSIIGDFSADALRFSLVALTATGQDVYISKEKFELGRNFGTKIWNAARFLQMNAGEAPPDVSDPDFTPELLTADDQHILARLHKTIAACDENIERCRFNDYAKAIYDFFWHEYCDWYVEYAKQPLNGTDAARKAEVLKVMHYVFANALRLLHPIMPFLTEELWQGLGYTVLAESVMIASWPRVMEEEELAAWGVQPAAVAYVDAKHAAIGLARNLRADYSLPPSQAADFVLRPADIAIGERVRADRAAYLPYLKAQKLEVEMDFTPAKAMPSIITPLGTLFMSLAGHVDVTAERQRLADQLQKTEQELAAASKRLENENFVSRAKPDVVEHARARKRELQAKREKLAKLIEALTPN
ncbi:MAG TPA: valine--tRNA ligase [Kiritimatiellia bacterium]|jgi:valyl-tRNA synthetase|nr:valine--tRNA ligase [Kiritimatiellia bacterium]OQC59117.1 MAG: Valine--tRNA ligase [Verrucomicrobia bacterium ADurb.Bin018]HOE00538.1 valine--tRNA ligase [Kiritimatiellia bacterium]HOU59292.1 valine--tRNA ligase [Kiritimatiellia bacterium]HPV47103.1 valine--tRNA ligase [Kiritimatiellia bacterium]